MEKDEGRRQRDLRQVLKSCERAADLVKQILSFSRKSDVQMKPADIRYVVKEAARADSRRHSDDHRHPAEYHVAVAGRPGQSDADPSGGH
ncbi:MAG: hypothetical protein LLG97_08935 [Deltaproteobacteria bacterium]|nr:hypothetical protein [Deltaproteobacteria bacterium]